MTYFPLRKIATFMFRNTFLRTTILLLQSTDRLPPPCWMNGHAEVWRTAAVGHTSSQCSRSEVGGEGWRGDWGSGRRATAGADGCQKRNMELSGWSAALRLLLKQRHRDRREVDYSFHQIILLLSWLSGDQLQIMQWLIQMPACELTLPVRR